MAAAVGVAAMRASLVAAWRYGRRSFRGPCGCIPPLWVRGSRPGWSREIRRCAGLGVPRGVGHGRGYRWGGGYWGGYWWPPVVFGADFLGFLPVLPAYCPVYWWDDVPYYYYNSAYYTWDSAEDGYVASEPPPAAAVYSSDDGAGDAGPGAPNTHTGPIDSGNLYAYPENGQTQQQQLQDRDECERWAASQSGSSADHPGGPDTVPASSSIDYRRALSACLTGRGYSVD